MNLTTFINIQDSLLEVDFKSAGDRLDRKPGQVLPKLDSWNVTEITSDKVQIQMAFTHSLYVSNLGGKDKISVKFLQPQLFKALRDNFTIAENYTVSDIIVPIQFTSVEEKEQVEQVTGAAEQSMLFSLIVPLLFMVFMSVSIGRVWSMYNML